VIIGLISEPNPFKRDPKVKLTQQEAKKELAGVFGDWFKKDGCAVLKKDLEDINGRAGPFLIELTKKQGLCWGGLFDFNDQKRG